MVLVRKVAAIAHALQLVRSGTVVVWVDLDVVLGRALDAAFLDFVRARDVSFLPETVCWAELGAFGSVDSPFGLPERCQDFRVDTGVVAVLASDKTRAFADWWLDAYAEGRATELATRCLRPGVPAGAGGDDCAHATVRSNLGLNDIYTFALATWAFRDALRFGWFADADEVTCAPSGDRALPGGHCHPCAARPGSPNARATALVSPFYLRRYLLHIKGGHGPMSRQHAAHPAARGALTHDAELELPREYCPVRPVHVDHRLACGDRRARYGAVWSLRQLRLVGAAR